MLGTSLTNVKNILKSLDNYPGEWELDNNIQFISLNNKGVNAYLTFLDRYYYLPLNVIFKDEQLIKSFCYGLCSLPKGNNRDFYFSKRIFLRNLIPNIDDVINSNGECAYKDVKRALRLKKDMYRDVYELKKKSEFYEDIIDEYNKYKLDIKLEDFIKISKKKYTRLLSGYNALLDFFNKPINVDKFIACFDTEQLYLFICYSLLKYNDNCLNLYSRLDYTIKYLDEYAKYIRDNKKENAFYNTHIILGSDKNIIYTIDDFIRDYKALISRVGK